MYEDPSFITAAQWASIYPMQVSLYAFVGCMIVFAFSLMMYVAIIPSMVGTHHLPERAMGYRPMFLVLTLGFFAVGVYVFVFQFAMRAGPIYEIYSKAWI